MKSKISAALIVAIFPALLVGCAGREYIMKEADINQLPNVNATYNVVWAKMHPVLLQSEGIGAAHKLHFKEGDNWTGIKVLSQKEPRLMVLVHQDFNATSEKAMISSRSGKRFYSLDGKRIYSKKGYLVPMFSWDKIKPISENGVEIWSEVKLNSEKDKKVRKIGLKKCRNTVTLRSNGGKNILNNLKGGKA